MPSFEASTSKKGKSATADIANPSRPAPISPASATNLDLPANPPARQVASANTDRNASSETSADIPQLVT